ncbi:MAG TPA: adenylosuccinate lyase [Bacteroidales bacterium]|nr:MAG: adenylosuccinate lyase [Bacteroidetes bacterium GWE2_42_24]OFY29949.1 MAG: adenylosuccinate lyase [Bacteroidetes bacterium GWF2_43_11]HBZ67864.1 adenylosuccinate lyase [Bacteroidales bacterium]
MFSPLTAVSPIDGRYYQKTSPLSGYFSEQALIAYRVKVEVEYFIALCRIPLPQLADFNRAHFGDLRQIYLSFGEAEATRIKNTESITNHDVKAVEYFLREEFDRLGLSGFKEFIHFGLTSQDINNTAMPMMLRDALSNTVVPALSRIKAELAQRMNDWINIPMLARTHGQPASPTSLGKEFGVFAERMENQLSTLRFLPHMGKFGGATGNFNAHHVAYPGIDWIVFANAFVNDILGLERQQYTTQIEHYDGMAALFDNLRRINIILLDLCRDIWSYVSMEYFRQKVKAGEVGSSAMPHKVNPIDFENAEGNLGIANALFEHFAAKLPISRLQRDLTDSTVTRNIGTPLAHILIAADSIIKGLNKLVLNEEKLKSDLNDNWAVVAEAIQTILRRENYPNPYEALKQLTRTGGHINRETIRGFISTLNVSNAVKAELLTITPENYTGIFPV